MHSPPWMLWQAALIPAQIVVGGVLWLVRRRQIRAREQTEFRLRLVLSSLRAERTGRRGLDLLHQQPTAQVEEARTLH